MGESDLTFILEWCCEKEGIGFWQVDGSGADSEGIIEPEGSPGPGQDIGTGYPYRGVRLNLEVVRVNPKLLELVRKQGTRPPTQGSLESSRSTCWKVLIPTRCCCMRWCWV